MLERGYCESVFDAWYRRRKKAFIILIKSK